MVGIDLVSQREVKNSYWKSRWWRSGSGQCGTGIFSSAEERGVPGAGRWMVIERCAKRASDVRRCRGCSGYVGKLETQKYRILLLAVGVRSSHKAVWIAYLEVADGTQEGAGWIKEQPELKRESFYKTRADFTGLRGAAGKQRCHVWEISSRSRALGLSVTGTCWIDVSCSVGCVVWEQLFA